MHRRKFLCPAIVHPAVDLALHVFACLWYGLLGLLAWVVLYVRALLEVLLARCRCAAPAPRLLERCRLFLARQLAGHALTHFGNRLLSLSRAHDRFFSDRLRSSLLKKPLLQLLHVARQLVEQVLEEEVVRVVVAHVVHEP